MKWGLKVGISIDADSGPPRYVLWCCGGICHQPARHYHSDWLSPYCGQGCCNLGAPPVFLRSFNPRYAHHIATCPPGFSDLSTAPLVCKPRFLLSIIFNKLLWTEPFLWEKNRLNSGLWTTPLQLVILNRKSTQRCLISWEWNKKENRRKLHYIE